MKKLMSHSLKSRLNISAQGISIVYLRSLKCDNGGPNCWVLNIGIRPMGSLGRLVKAYVLVKENC